ncbi:MAG: DUF420 domain-containing protein [Bacteroidota bacterium]|nr:DUF420 domain-containing protein [Bacteroidota bacterium]
MRKIHIDSSIDFSFLPAVYSSLNAFCAVILIIAYIHIRKGKIDTHRRLMKTAVIISSLFLFGYVLYHTTTPETLFCKQGPIRTIYFILLISHVILAAVSFPFVVFTFIRGLTGQVARHKKLARWVFPIWLYVCISGPLCYVLLYPCYK